MNTSYRTVTSDCAYLPPVEQRLNYMRDWSCITLPPNDAIWVGAGGISKRGRDFINGLFDRIIALEIENAYLREKHGD